MARLETVETDLRANLERLRTRRKKDSDGKKNGETEKKPTEENTLEGALEAYLSSASVGAASADQNSARFKKLAIVLRTEIDKSVAEKTAGMVKQLEANSKALNSVAKKSDISRLEQQLKSLSDSLGKIQDGKDDSGNSSGRTRPSGATLQNIRNR